MQSDSSYSKPVIKQERLNKAKYRWRFRSPIRNISLNVTTTKDKLSLAKMELECYKKWKICLTLSENKKLSSKRSIILSSILQSGAPNENIVHNHLNIELLNVF